MFIVLDQVVSSQPFRNTCHRIFTFKSTHLIYIDLMKAGVQMEQIHHVIAGVCVQLSPTSASLIYN